MTISKRICSNCAAFNQHPTGEDPTCWDLVSITERANTPQAVTREPMAQDEGCHDHLTTDEDKAQTELIEEHREADGFNGALLASMAVSETAQAMSRARGYM